MKIFREKLVSIKFQISSYLHLCIKNTKYLFIPTNLGGKKLLKVNRGITWAVPTKIDSSTMWC